MLAVRCKALKGELTAQGAANVAWAAAKLLDYEARAVRSEELGLSNNYHPLSGLGTPFRWVVKFGCLLKPSQEFRGVGYSQ